MTRVLVLGGYGGFGGRVARLLAEDGFAVIVAGRSLARARAFSAACPALRIEADEVDREASLAPVLARIRPWLVIDAAGPFQNSDYRVARACIAAGCHYADLADARAFVNGIDALDAAAKAAGVAVISGASSLPALSTAVVDALAQGLGSLADIDIALSASNRASGSRSVTRAILSYVGKPIAIWNGARWREGFGWQEMGHVRFALDGRPALRRRVALCDVPDLDSLTARYPGRPATRFRAGTEIELQNIALWLLSGAVRRRWLGSALPFAGLGLAAQRLLARVGGDRSAMLIRVRGRAGSRSVERRWTLLAERGDGPWTPSLAAPLLAGRLAAGEVRAGARGCGGELGLTEFEAMFGRFALFTGREEREPVALYRRVMRDSFDRVPADVRAMHEPLGTLRAAGRVSVTRGRSPLARLIGWLFSFPPAMTDAPISVEISEDEGRETWTRDFDGHKLVSRMHAQRGHIVERFGLLSFRMALRVEPDGLTMHQRGWRAGPLPMPRALGPIGVAAERAIGGRFHFEVPLALPLIGPLIHYRGWLEVAKPDQGAIRAPSQAKQPPLSTADSPSITSSKCAAATAGVNTEPFPTPR